MVGIHLFHLSSKNKNLTCYEYPVEYHQFKHVEFSMLEHLAIAISQSKDNCLNLSYLSYFTF